MLKVKKRRKRTRRVISSPLSRSSNKSKGSSQSRAVLLLLTWTTIVLLITLMLLFYVQSGYNRNLKKDSSSPDDNEMKKDNNRFDLIPAIDVAGGRKQQQQQQNAEDEEEKETESVDNNNNNNNDIVAALKTGLRRAAEQQSNVVHTPEEAARDLPSSNKEKKDDDKDVEEIEKKYNDDDNDNILSLRTVHGIIRIIFRKDLSKESANYIRKVVTNGCNECNFYRAEKGFLLQGVFKNPDIPINTVFGPCPPEYRNVKQNCPNFNPNCTCHGPVMTRGMVGWDGGSSGGPDFFIDTYPNKADFWGNLHTIWGEIEDDESLEIIENTILNLPTTKEGQLTMLAEKLDFIPELVLTQDHAQEEEI